MSELNIRELKAAATAAKRFYPDWPDIAERLTTDGYVSFFVNFIAKVGPDDILTLLERLQVAENAAKDAERLDFIAKNPEMQFRYHKKKKTMGFYWVNELRVRAASIHAGCH